MKVEIQEKFKWTMMESDECNRIGSTKRRKRWKKHGKQPNNNNNKNNNKNINTNDDKNHDERKTRRKCNSSRISDNNGTTHLLTHILQQESKQQTQKHRCHHHHHHHRQQQQQQEKEKDGGKNTLVSLLLKQYSINWSSCFCYLSWSNFRWLAVISVLMETITLQTAYKQHKNQNTKEVKKKVSERKYNNYSEFVQSSVYSAASCNEIQKIDTKTSSTTTTKNIIPTIKETLSSASSAIITSTIIPATATTNRNTNILNWRQKLPIFSWNTTVAKSHYHLLLLLLAVFNICQYHHAAAYAALIPQQQDNSSAKEALALLKYDQSHNNMIVNNTNNNNNNNKIYIKNEDNFVGVLEGAGDSGGTLEKLDNHTLKSYSIIDGNSLAVEHLENTLLMEAKRTFSATVEPIFDFGMPRNISARTGQGEAVIKCRVEELHDKSVSWIRKRDLHILSVGTATYTSDKRFEVTGSKDQREWSLHVKAPQPRDSGIYECQINTEPKISMAFQLNIIEISPDAKAVINGPADLHFKVGSAIILSCVVQQPSIKDIGPIYWYRGEHMITPFEIDENSDAGASTADFEEFDSNANEVLEIGPPKSISNAAFEDSKRLPEQSTANEITQDFTTRIAMESQLGDTLKSRLRISNAQKTDTGNYTCQPTTASSASVLVHVINDENPAAMQKSVAVALHRTPDTLFCTITAVVVIQVMLVVAFLFQQHSLVNTARRTTTIKSIAENKSST